MMSTAPAAPQAIAPEQPQLTAETKPAFLGDIHAFRGIAITLVVAIHVLSAFSWPGEGGAATRRVLMSILQNSTVLFVFIAGYLFHHLSSRFEFRKYIRNKARNVLLPYFIVSIPAIVYFTVFVERQVGVRSGFYDGSLLRQVVEFYLTGAHLAPYWFIPVVAIYYLLAPLFLRLSRSPAGMWILVPFIAVSVIVPRGAVIPSAIHFFSVYLAGVMASRFRQPVLDLVSRRWALVAGLALIVVLGVVEWELGVGPMTYVNYLQKLVVCFVLMGILHRHWRRLPDWVGAVAATSFGIYFLHSYLISGYKLAVTELLGELPHASILGIVVGTALVMMICHLAVRGVQRLFGTTSRMLIGA